MPLPHSLATSHVSPSAQLPSTPRSSASASAPTATSTTRWRAQDTVTSKMRFRFPRHCPASAVCVYRDALLTKSARAAALRLSGRGLRHRLLRLISENCSKSIRDGQRNWGIGIGLHVAFQPRRQPGACACFHLSRVCRVELQKRFPLLTRSSHKTLAHVPRSHSRHHSVMTEAMPVTNSDRLCTISNVNGSGRRVVLREYRSTQTATPGPAGCPAIPGNEQFRLDCVPFRHGNRPCRCECINPWHSTTNLIHSVS